MIHPALIKAANSYAQRVVGEGKMAPSVAGGGLSTMPDPAGQQKKRPQVKGLATPRRPRSGFSPADLGRQKGTPPTNPFSGNWQKVEKATTLKPPEVKLGAAKLATTLGQAAGQKPVALERAMGFMGRQLQTHPIRTAAGVMLLAKSPAIYRAARDGVTEERQTVSQPTALASRAVMQGAQKQMALAAT